MESSAQGETLRAHAPRRIAAPKFLTSPSPSVYKFIKFVCQRRTQSLPWLLETERLSLAVVPLYPTYVMILSDSEPGSGLSTKLISSVFRSFGGLPSVL